MKTFRIGFIGKRRAGKDYLAQLVPDCQILSFSDSLKQIAVSVFPWMKVDYLPEEKEQPLNIKINSGQIIQYSPREIWNQFDFLRRIDGDVFINRVEKQIVDNLNSNLIVKDVRKYQELATLKRYNFKFVYIFNDFEKHQDDEHDVIVEGVLRQYADFEFKNKKNGKNIQKLLDYINSTAEER